MKLVYLLLALAAAFALWNWKLGKLPRHNSAYPDNWDSLSALDQRRYLAALNASFEANFTAPGYE